MRYLCGILCFLFAIFWFTIAELNQRYLKRGGYDGQSGTAKEAADGTVGGLMISSYIFTLVSIGMGVWILFTH